VLHGEPGKSMITQSVIREFLALFPATDLRMRPAVRAALASPGIVAAVPELGRHA